MAHARPHSYQDVVSPSLPGGLQSRLPQLHHMVEPGWGPMLRTPFVCVGPGANHWIKYNFGSSTNGKKAVPKSSIIFDSLGLLHGSPLHIVVDVLGSFQPLTQHGRGVVHIVVCRCPKTEAEWDDRVKGHLTAGGGVLGHMPGRFFFLHEAEQNVYLNAAEE